MSQSSLVAIIPAAGLSRRMGQPKLLLPWRGDTVIGHLVRELQAANVSQIFVVIRSSDDSLAKAVIKTGATPVLPPVDPPDMRSSVEWGLQAAYGLLDNPIHLDATSGWLLIPADHPIVSHQTIEALRAAWQPGQRQILVPTYSGRRGHPTLFSANFVSDVNQIPLDCGLNWVLKQHAASIIEIPVADPGILVDLDTPEDYQALLARLMN